MVKCWQSEAPLTAHGQRAWIGSTALESRSLRVLEYKKQGSQA